jgi:hypothetical protein
MARKACVGLLFASLAFGCSTVEPLDMAATTQSAPALAKLSDQSIIADKVRQGEFGVAPLAWSNPDTGSAGVIEDIGPAESSGSHCRTFITTRRTLAGESRFNGIACPSDDSKWKLR